MISESATQIEDYLNAGEVTGRIFDRTIGRVIVGNVQLRQLDLRVHNQRIRYVPDEHQVLRRVRHCNVIIFSF